MNQSRLPDPEVADLIRFAFRGVADAGVVVKVKNSRKGYRGTAYHGVPARSSEAGKATARRLVTIGIGPDETFPTDNASSSQRLIHRIDIPHYRHGAGMNVYQEARKITSLSIGADLSFAADFPRDGGAIVKVYRTERHPYGGKGSPAITVSDWREALVMVAAHEARHIYQFAARDRGKRVALSEVDAEKHAAKRLAEYRKTR